MQLISTVSVKDPNHSNYILALYVLLCVDTPDQLDVDEAHNMTHGHVTTYMLITCDNVKSFLDCAVYKTKIFKEKNHLPSYIRNRSRKKILP